MPTAHNDALPIVLVVEDEMVLRMRAVDIVEDAGFSAVEAVNADQALAILETRSDIAVLFSDIQMPGTMDGLRLAQAVKVRWPSIKIVLVSGRVKLSEDDKPAESLFFAKPLDTEQMIAELQAMVGDSSHPQMPVNLLPATARKDLSEPRRILPTVSFAQDILSAENDSLRLLLEQAAIDAKGLLAQAGIDAKEREAADKLQKLILEEMHHRIKNTLATVSAISTQSLRTAPSIAYGQKAIAGRLLALGRAHDLLLQASWSNANLTDLVSGAIEPYGGQDNSRISVDGPDLGLISSAVIALAMTLNELCTNTTKYGALSVPTGTVEISWAVTDNERLRLTWVEKGGPPVAEPTRRGFGTRMIRSVAGQLGGLIELGYHQSGLVYALDVPLKSLTGDQPIVAI